MVDGALQTHHHHGMWFQLCILLTILMPSSVHNSSATIQSSLALLLPFANRPTLLAAEGCWAVLGIPLVCGAFSFDWELCSWLQVSFARI